VQLLGCCREKPNGQLCGEGHKWGFVAKLKDGSITIIGNYCARDKFGADALRFSLMLLAASGSDVYLSDEKFLVGRNFCNKIWNATRFLFSKIEEAGFKLDDCEFDLKHDVDQWIIQRLNLTIEEVSSRLEDYRLNEAAKAVYEFFWHDFCDWYLEITKDDFTIDRAKISFQVITDCLKLLHPFMPFITEDINQLIREHTGLSLSKAIIKGPWPSAYKGSLDQDSIGWIVSLFNTIRNIRNIKVDLGIGVKKVILEVSSSSFQNLWERNHGWIKRLAGLEGIEFKNKLDRVLYKSENWSLNFSISSIDTASFVSSLEKKRQKIQVVLDKVSARLSNRNFLSKAPESTVAQERQKSQELSLEVQRLEELSNAFK